MKCGRPALWLFADTRYTPINTEEVKKTTEYEMANLIKTDYDPFVAGTYFCDSCNSEVEDDNIVGSFMVFIDLPNTKVVQ